MLKSITPVNMTFGCQSDRQETTKTKSSKASTFFKLVPEQESHLIFANTLIEDLEANHINYEYVYAGGGLAIGDINNDGLEDIYLIGNKVPDKLFLNEGSMRFTDISSKAGIEISGDWHTGVTMADVNGDGWLDIYVSRSGWFKDPSARANLLYINNQDNTFVEQASTYGLADTNHNIQASFFDYDKDGDLDMYSMGHPAGVFGLKTSIREYLQMVRSGQVESDRFYRNDDGHFVDISSAVGITDYAFGLGIVAADINDDGWTDIYVANDYEEPDLMYINDQNGGFKDQIREMTGHISNYGMGVDVADFNNDLLVDIFTADMSFETHERAKRNMPSMSTALFWTRVAIGWHYQYMSNSLQLNHGNNSFSEIAQLSGINKTDWSWAALFADLDRDGLKDLVITNGIKKDIFDNDSPEIINSKAQTTPISLEDILEVYPSSRRHNYLFKNNGDLTFSDVSEDWGLGQPVNSNGAAYADLDNDGDLDLVINNIDSDVSLYENKSDKLNSNHYVSFRLLGIQKNTEAIGTKVYVWADDLALVQEVQPTRGYLSRVSSKLFFGLGGHQRIDSIKIIWPDLTQSRMVDLEVDQTIILNQEEIQSSVTNHPNIATADFLQDISSSLNVEFVHTENRFEDYKKQILLPHAYSQWGPALSVGDVNGDSREDFFIGGASGQSGQLFVQGVDGKFATTTNGPWLQDITYEDLGSAFFDVDNDEDLDLYVVSGGYEFEEDSPLHQDRLYINDGNGRFTRSSDALPRLNQSGQAIAVGDIDSDGDEDLFVGGRLVPGKYPMSPSSYFLENVNGQFKVKEDQPSEFGDLGLVTAGEFADLDLDGDPDLIVSGEWMPITIFINEDGTFYNKTSSYNLDKTVGWWYDIEVSDIDGDGDIDIIGGNLGMNHKFKASTKKPLHIYYSDFDGNSTFDPILAHVEDESILPYRGKECSSEQMPFVSEKFKDFNSFSNASISDILGSEMKNAKHHEAYAMESMYFINDGNGSFQVKKLPILSQFSPTLSILPLSSKGQTKSDFLLAGNILDVEIETIRYDSGVGSMISFDGERFTAVSPKESGVFLPYNVRDLATIETINGPILIVASSNDRLRVYPLRDYNHTRRDTNQL